MQPLIGIAALLALTACHANQPSPCLDGSPALVVHTSAPPVGLAVDVDTVYWADAITNSIMMAPLTGGAAVTLVTASARGQVAADGTNVYWVDGLPGNDSLRSILRVPKGGGDVVTIAGELSRLTAVALTKTDVCWSIGLLLGRGSIECAPKDGGASRTFAGFLTNPRLLTSNGTDLAWSQDGSDLIWARGDGHLQRRVATRTSAMVLSLDFSNLYWVDRSEHDVLMKAPVIAGQPQIISDGNFGAMQVAGECFYWTDVVGPALMSAPMRTGPLNMMTMDLPHGNETVLLASNGSTLVWNGNPFGTSIQQLGQ